MTAPFMILMDAFEVTMLLDDVDFANIRSGLGEAKTERGFRMLTQLEGIIPGELHRVFKK